MLYYKTGLVRRVRMHPKYIVAGKHPHQIVRKMLKQDIRETPFSTEYGYIVDRIAVEKIEEGFCLPLVGFVEFVVTFEAILLYPVVGEVVYAVVEKVTDTCVIFRHACVFGVVRSYCLDEHDLFKYEEQDVVPENQEKRTGTIKEGLFRSQTDPCKSIQKGTVVRVRITSRTLGGNGFFLIGSMSSQYLGPCKNPAPVSPVPISPVSKPDDEMMETIVPALRTIGIPDDEMLKIRFERQSSEVDSDEDDNISVASLELD